MYFTLPFIYQDLGLYIYKYRHKLFAARIVGVCNNFVVCVLVNYWHKINEFLILKFLHFCLRSRSFYDFEVIHGLNLVGIAENAACFKLGGITHIF